MSSPSLLSLILIGQMSLPLGAQSSRLCCQSRGHTANLRGLRGRIRVCNHPRSSNFFRSYYHEKLAPASDVDLFLYGLDEKQAVEKIKQIETRIRDSILSETTTIRTKNAITIASQYPIRHVQIVLRLYKNVSEILTGFDVDCSSVAYDGSQVWATPRAIGALITQINTIDLSRRSPSYENRLSKYSHRGFEVFWPLLDRSRIDPTIFERSFSRVMGLGRLLVLEKLPHPNDRDDYLAKRRAERGRPKLPWNARFRHQLPGNVKDQQPDDVAEWVEEDEVSNYHTFTVPYGPKYNAKKIEKLLFTKDLLLNAEWNRPKDRETTLHRHPAFFGSVNDVIHDCCGFCPSPSTDEDLAAAEEEQKIYVHGDIDFIKDDPGRQAIGSFNPITDDDWTEMAFVGNTTRLCQAIVDCDLEGVQDWCDQEDADVNRRDHTGRTPLQLAAMCGTIEIVQCLIDHGARLVARIYDGFTALHIAACRGHTGIVEALLERSEANEEEESRKEEERKAARRAELKEKDRHNEEAEKGSNARKIGTRFTEEESEDDENESVDLMDQDLIDSDESEGYSDRMTEGSFVRIRDNKQQGFTMPDDADEDEPDVYDIDVLAWDNPVSPLHLAILGGHVETIETLVDSFGADVMLPIKLVDEYDRSPRGAILTLVIAMRLPLQESLRTTKALLALGASSSQADMDEISALHYVITEGSLDVLDLLVKYDGPAARTAVNHLSVNGYRYSPRVSSPLLTAIRARKSEMVEKLLSLGAEPVISQDAFARAMHRKFEHSTDDPEEIRKQHSTCVQQPIVEAVITEQPSVASQLLRKGADPAILTKEGHQFLQNPTSVRYHQGKREALLDLVQDKLKMFRQFRIADKKLSGAPPNLRHDGYYLEGLPVNTYRHWLARRDLEEAKEISSLLWKKYDKEVSEVEWPEQGAEEKLVQVQSFIMEMEAFDKVIKKAGAKTFDKMYPDIQPPNVENPTHTNYHGRNSDSKKEYETFQNFLVADLTPAMKDAYFKLFEAAWIGDTSTIKSLTLSPPQGLRDPLQIAVRDLRGYSPFSIAALRNHKDCAKAIMDIATVQYRPQRKVDRIRYRLQPADSDDDVSVSSEAGIEVYNQLVDEDFTIADIGNLSAKVKSTVSPAELLDWTCQVWRFYEKPSNIAKASFEPRFKLDTSYFGWQSPYSQDHFDRVLSNEDNRNRHSIAWFAIVRNDIALLKFILDLGCSVTTAQEDENASKIYDLRHGELDLAIKLGRLEMIRDIIRRSGARIPLQSLVSESGVQIQEKPRYYQGLSVHGKKRKDWADAGRGIFYTPIENAQSPLFSVTFEGNIDTLEFFLSNTPLRLYTEFAEAHLNDKRIAALSQSKDGLDKALNKWLHSNRHLLLHVAVASEPRKDGSTALLKCILDAIPESLDTKCLPDRLTPLALAFNLRRYNAARFLISTGADQVARDSLGRNLVHIILQNVSEWGSHASVLYEVLSLLDPKLLPSMFIERCAMSGMDGPGPGATTPLALLLHTDSSCSLELVEAVLEYSQCKDLEIMDGAGDYPLHTVARNGRADLAKLFLEKNRELLGWENATGMTAFEIVAKSQLAGHVNRVSRLPGEVGHSSMINTHPNLFLKRHIEDDRKNEISVGDGGGKIYGNGEAQICELFERLTKMDEKNETGLHIRRKLVSLYDANEVAKRLARQNRRDRKLSLQGGGRNEDEEDAYERKPLDSSDLSSWIGGGRGKKKRDLEALEWRLKHGSDEEIPDASDGDED